MSRKVSPRASDALPYFPFTYGVRHSYIRSRTPREVARGPEPWTQSFRTPWGYFERVHVKDSPVVEISILRMPPTWDNKPRAVYQLGLF